jgi:hypothetical protein
MVVQNGHRLAMSLASRNFSPTCALSEAWNGIHQLQTIKGLADDLTDEKLKSISEDLASIGKTIFEPANVQMALIGEAQALRSAAAFPKTICRESGNHQIPANPADAFGAPEVKPGDNLPREGWSVSSAVSFVAQAFQTVRMDHEDAPALSVISKILRSLYLHREIREKGCAYGGFATYNPDEGLFYFASYRDPHIVSTLNVYDKGFAFIRSGGYDEKDILEAILQVCSEIDKPDPPATAAGKAFHRKIASVSDELRERFTDIFIRMEPNRPWP